MSYGIDAMRALTGRPQQTAAPATDPRNRPRIRRAIPQQMLQSRHGRHVRRSHIVIGA
ncbi:hypothetical protein GCM10027063_26930 [Promicromonospora xylanilytica]